MDMAKITKRTVDKLAPGERERTIFDDDLKGFGVRVRPSGAASYIIMYRAGGGRSGTLRKMTLGAVGKLTPDEARKAARALLGAVAHGGDPAGKRQADRRAPTVAELMARYLAEHVELHNKPRTREGCARLARQRIVPELGHMKVAAVTREDVRRLHAKLKTTPYEANRTLAALSKAMAIGSADWNMRPDNPCRGVKRYAEHKRERFYSHDELARLGAVLADSELRAVVPAGAIAAIRLLALSGCRLSEVLSLEWAHVDFANGALRLADAKSGARMVPLGAPALALLSALHRKGARWVIEGLRPGQPFSMHTLEKIWARVRVKAELGDARMHDLRHTVGTYAGQTGANAFMVRDVLGHKTLAMTGRYVERDASPLRGLMDDVAGRVAGSLDGRKPAEVVSLRNRARVP
jgi:integrase